MTQEAQPKGRKLFAGIPYKDLPVLKAEWAAGRPTLKIIHAVLLNEKGEQIAAVRTANDAAAIQMRCNSHDALVAALQAVLPGVDEYWEASVEGKAAIAQARAALKAAA